MVDIKVLNKRDPRQLASHFHYVKKSRDDIIYEASGNKRLKLAGSLIIDFLASRIERNKFLLLINFSFYGIY
jgi:hypothetical protein